MFSRLSRWIIPSHFSHINISWELTQRKHEHAATFFGINRCATLRPQPALTCRWRTMCWQPPAVLNVWKKASTNKWINECCSQLQVIPLKTACAHVLLDDVENRMCSSPVHLRGEHSRGVRQERLCQVKRMSDKFNSSCLLVLLLDYNQKHNMRSFMLKK